MSAPTRATSAPSAPTTTLTVRYFAGAKAAAGTRSEDVTVPAGATVDDLVAALAADHGEALARVLAAASFLLDEVAVRDRTVVPASGAVVDVLPPFAGG
ncbi:MoaD/ThiS family protein [Actinomycetospora sp. CA-101289]|uniref:MoaD/ThiS family protein n=1 Tax=Actinomycetospora sp. CA-101289 TaxID=3239893 RepID=UPI003D96761F